LPYVAIVAGLIQIAQELIVRGRKTGELTDQEASDLAAKAVAIFAQYSTAPPPPPGV
jgi:hypothetical protein